MYVNPFADSILSTAGSGDVLAGVIGGLLSQKSTSPAQKGVYIHFKAAELLKTEGRTTTIVATDLLDAVSKVNIVGDS
jgi:NAD(P)H-hydrate repair Nnr-like enzyme with NAD(P)H-hydrate dehydratase domain